MTAKAVKKPGKPIEFATETSAIVRGWKNTASYIFRNDKEARRNVEADLNSNEWNYILYGGGTNYNER